MKKLICLTIVSFIALSIVKSVDSLTVNQLHAKYFEIFPRTGNRNAASHLWSSYVLNRASQAKVKTDPLTINTADGTKVFNSFVIGKNC